MSIIEYDRFYIGGQWTAPASAARIDVTEAATEERVGSVPEGTEADIDAAVDAARKAFDDPEGWATWSPEQRGEVLERFAVAIEARGAETARRVSVQNGMPIWLAQSFEAGFPALLLRYYTGLVAAGQEEVRAGMLGKKSLIRRDPVGVVAAIVPWNVPQAISFLKLAPALAAGNTVVLKPAPETVSTRSSWPRPRWKPACRQAC
jgi:acyl-CoA reductase-like NAD-dependent aldehyde dehydrogenase